MPAAFVLDTMKKITIKDIIRWEQLRQKSFSDFDVTDDDDVITLMYIVDKISKQYETYKEVADARPDLVKKTADEISKYMRYMSQFAEPDSDAEDACETADEKEESARISDVVMNIIYSGVDAGYVMNEAEICDIPLLARGCEGKMRRRMEESRLWTFMTLSPYLDEKCKTPSALYRFSWEDENEESAVSDDDIEAVEGLLN